MTELRLQRCDLARCEAVCCYDGVYLRPGEEAGLVTTVRAHPEFFRFLPAAFVLDGVWNGRPGRKTAVRPHDYRRPDYPAHFARTRCVFAFDDGRCSLQVLAITRGEHPWAYKPRVCWLHPLFDGPAGLVPPPVDTADDPDRRPGYPGFTTFTDCGRHRPDGLPWLTALKEEGQAFQSKQSATTCRDNVSRNV
jgi:hypothetical protein